MFKNESIFFIAGFLYVIIMFIILVTIIVTSEPLDASFGTGWYGNGVCIKDCLNYNPIPRF